MATHKSEDCRHGFHEADDTETGCTGRDEDGRCYCRCHRIELCPIEMARREALGYATEDDLIRAEDWA